MSNTYVHPITGEVLPRVRVPQPQPPQQPQVPVESSSSEVPMMISDYFARFSEHMVERFQENDMMEDQGWFFSPSVFVSRDNKRRVVFYVTNGEPDVARNLTRVSYIFPMSEDAAKALYRLEDAQPDEGPHFEDVVVPAGQNADAFMAAYAAGNNLVHWNQEMQRVKGLIENATSSKIKRTLGNLMYYWRNMRGRLYDAIHRAAIRVMHKSSGSLRTSEKARRRRSTSAQTRPSSLTASASSGSRRATTGQRTSSRLRKSSSLRFSSRNSKKATGSRKTSSRNRRNTRKSNNDPRNSTSDPI